MKEVLAEATIHFGIINYFRIYIKKASVGKNKITMATIKSIEEKAQRYDEALEKARLVLQERGNEPDGASILSELFPELKEGEDEKIRKWIIDDIRYNMNNEPLNNSEYKKKAEKAIAWLEKQGKHDIGISEDTKQELEDNLNKALEKETPESWNEFLDEQGEQKPTDKIEPKFHKGEWITIKQ